MIKKIIALIPLLFTFWLSPVSAQVNVIFDTDLGTLGGDVDDLGALAVLHGLANDGDARVLGVMLDHNWNKQAISAVDAVNTFYGRPNIPVGRRDGGISDLEYNYADRVSEQHSHDIDVDNAPSATWLYRNILVNQPNNSVTIVTTGKLHNIDALLKSGADSNSSLSGRDLVNQKVARIHTMGGHYPSSYSQGSAESNFANSENCGVRDAVNNSPRPMVFNGFEIGAREEGYSTGSDLNSLNNNNPVKTGYSYWFQTPPSWASFLQSNSIGNWSIWDQIAIFNAVKGSGIWFNEVNFGFNDVACDGNNFWNTDSDRNHTYLTREMDPKTFADNVIQPLMKSLPNPNTSGNSNSDDLSGVQRLTDGWQGRVLHLSNNVDWAAVQSAPLNADWSSQRWNFERISGNRYRIRNMWSQGYLTAPSVNDWDNVRVAPLVEDWNSQRWDLEKVGNQYRIKNVWSGLYLHTQGDAWSEILQAPLQDWSSMLYTLDKL